MPKNTERVTLTGPERIAGSRVEAGDSVEVYPFQKRHMVQAGSVAGGVEDIASDGEKQAGALNALKRQEDRDDVEVWTVQKAHEEGAGFGESQDSEKSSSEEPKSTEEPKFSRKAK